MKWQDMLHQDGLAVDDWIFIAALGKQPIILQGQRGMRLGTSEKWQHLVKLHGQSFAL
jgi:hypothetical protein